MDDEKEASISFDNYSPSPSNQSNYSSQHTNTTKITICIGKNQQQYNLNDLQLLSYFEALFSSRWKYIDDIDNELNINNSIIIGDNKSLQFGMEELTCIVHIKKYNHIPVAYNYKKLILLCNGCDFFGEDILNEELLIHFFKKCKPSLSYKTITDLTKLNNNINMNKFHKFISNSAIKYLRNIQNNIVTMKEQWLETYKLLPILHVSYDNDMISQIFVRSYSIQWVQIKNEMGPRKWMIQCGNLKSFFHVWKIIKKRQLYKYDRLIFETIEKMCNDIDISVPIHHNVDDSVLIVLKKIFIETMQIVVMFNNENKMKIMKHIEENNNNNSFDEDEDTKTKTEYYYDYNKFNLQELIRTHMEFVIVNRKKYFEIDELKQILSIAYYMNGIQKYSFLKILLSFHNDWIENINNIKHCDEYILQWNNLLKYLISSASDYSINCVKQWLNIFIDESKFVLNIISNQLNTDGSHKLAFAIANYVTTNKINDKKNFDPKYMKYINNSLGLKWKLNDNVIIDEDNINNLTININDNNLFNV